MFCPRCGASQSDESKFCKLCGANLHAVRQVVDTRETEEKFDWSKTWVAEMFLSHDEMKRRKEQLQRKRGITPAVKRITEIKAGVITSSAGLALTIVLKILMEGIVLSGKATPDVAEILSRLWVAGVIPLLIGFALIVNGVIVSKRLIELDAQSPTPDPEGLEGAPNPRSIRSADTNEFIPAGYSVTEQTTQHLKSGEQKK